LSSDLLKIGLKNRNDFYWFQFYKEFSNRQLQKSNEISYFKRNIEIIAYKLWLWQGLEKKIHKIQ